MRQYSIPLLLLTLVLGMGLSGSVSAFDEPVYESGYVDWEINPIERLYVEGMDETDAVLQRQKSDNAPGGISINSGFTGQILNLNSEPIQNGFSATVNMSVFFSVYLSFIVWKRECNFLLSKYRHNETVRWKMDSK